MGNLHEDRTFAFCYKQKALTESQDGGFEKS
jgi:hypothetical protein